MGRAGQVARTGARRLPLPARQHPRPSPKLWQSGSNWPREGRPNLLVAFDTDVPIAGPSGMQAPGFIRLGVFVGRGFDCWVIVSEWLDVVGRPPPSPC